MGTRPRGGLGHVNEPNEHKYVDHANPWNCLKAFGNCYAFGNGIGFKLNAHIDKIGPYDCVVCKVISNIVIFAPK